MNRWIGSAVAVVAAVALLGTAVATAATPKLSKQQVHSLRQTCRYFPSDYEGLVGGLKMSNLSGRELKEATRYVSGDLKAAEPPLNASAKALLTKARKVLAQVAAGTPLRPVSTAEKNHLGKRFRSAPFPMLSKTVETACRHLPKHGG